MKKYLSTDKMRSLIRDNSSLLMVMSRFGISLGFGEKTVREICTDAGVDCQTFLAVANFISRKEDDCSHISLPSLINYLKRAHSYFLNFSLPTIRRKLIDAIDCSGTNDLAFLILKFYDGYVTEVRRHMEYENRKVFTYVEELLQDRPNDTYCIRNFGGKHNHIDSKLKELKDIIIRYYPEKENDLLNSVLFDIINCEQDLNSHCLVEEQLFVPAVEKIEQELKNRNIAASIPPAKATPSEEDKTVILSDREKDIISCVARGMANKEIAEQLCLSINTVTTHRRNITKKLQIHTSNGLTIYAIVNKLVELQDIKPV